MCKEAKEIQEDYSFAEGDCFYHPDYGVGEILRTRDDKITNTPDEAVDLSFSDCTWLPTVKELKEMVPNLTEQTLQEFLNTGDVHKKPVLFFRKEEEQWLAYIMFDLYEKIWSLDKNTWIDRN